MDYKELIKRIEDCCEFAVAIEEDDLFTTLKDAAIAIVTLLAEREAAVEELRGICWCCVHGKKWDKAPEWSKMTACEHMKEQFGRLARSGGKSKCPHWQWRGPTPPDRERTER